MRPMIAPACGAEHNGDIMHSVDLFVVGGGINGAAVARDAAGRGLSVMLVDKNDYANATSSASSKLIHGGLRYLEHYEFSLVREALREREILLKIAPHLVFPLRFLVPIKQDQKRPAWLMWLGLKLYDLLSGRQLLAPSGRLDTDAIGGLTRLRPNGLRSVLHYPDCWADDARLVLETLLDARSRGAKIANYHEVTAIEPAPDGFIVNIRGNGQSHSVRARFVINAAGPWADRLANQLPGKRQRQKLRLVRGSHIVLKMPAPADDSAFTLQNSDGRIVFTIPWLDRRYLVIGTTDAQHEGDPSRAACSNEERDYLLAAYNRYFEHPNGAAKPKDIIWSWSGVRALVDNRKNDPSKVTRSARIRSKRQGTGGFVSIFGGKLTTHRRLAEKVMDRVTRMGATMELGWTASEPLHGGKYDRVKLAQIAAEGPASLSEELRYRWAFTYGDQCLHLFENVLSSAALAKQIVPGVLEAELRHARDIEDARTGADFLMRRTKLFLALSETDAEKINRWFDKYTK